MNKNITLFALIIPSFCLGASNLPLDLDFYRNQYNPIGSNDYFYSTGNPAQRSAFKGWEFDVPVNQRLEVKNTGCRSFPIGKNGVQAGVFTVASNGAAVILHPNIPINYFDGTHVCSAQVSLYEGDKKIKDVSMVTARLQPPPSDALTGEIWLYNVDDTAGGSPFTWCSSPYDASHNPILLPIFVEQANGATPQISVYQWQNGHYEMGNYSNFANTNIENPNYTKYGLFSRQIKLQANFLGCNQSGQNDQITAPVYYTVLNDKGEEGEHKKFNETLDISALSQPVKIKIHWQKSAIKGTENKIHTLSAGLQTRDRYEYGTFQAVMTPQSDKTGILSSFYSFFGNGHLPMPGGTLPGSVVSNNQIKNFGLYHNGGDQLQLRWTAVSSADNFVLQVVQGQGVATSFIEHAPGTAWPSSDFIRTVQVQPDNSYVIKIAAYQGKRPSDDEINKLNLLPIDVKSAALLNWGYTWHEIDFELIKGPHTLNYFPYFGADGTITPFTTAETIDRSISLNAFFAGNYAFDLPSAWQKHRYCPNANDVLCGTAASSVNVYDGQPHVFTFTWDHEALSYYVDGFLLSSTPIEFSSLGGTEDGPMANQFQFNNAIVTDAEGKKQVTSPQYISLNMWVPAFSDWFGANYDDNALQGEEKAFADYAKAAWSPCVATRDEIKQGNAILDKSACASNRYIGQVYTSDGKQQPQPASALTWDFKKLAASVSKQMPVSTVLWRNGWMYAPKMSFDYNNSIFVQNNALLDVNHGLRLCMTNQWNHMAALGVTSKGCDDKPVLPRPGEFNEGDTDPQQALLVIHAHLQGSSAGIKALLGRTLPGLLPRLPMNYPLSVNPGFLNNGWEDGAARTSCVNGSMDGKFCAGNGWYADSRFQMMTSTRQIEAVIMFPVQTQDVKGNPVIFTSFVPTDADENGAVNYNGAVCKVSYSLENGAGLPLQLEAQQTYIMNAEVTCEAAS